VAGVELERVTGRRTTAIEPGAQRFGVLGDDEVIRIGAQRGAQVLLDAVQILTLGGAARQQVVSQPGYRGVELERALRVLLGPGEFTLGEVRARQVEVRGVVITELVDDRAAGAIS
jgi:hypothetical protein